uniref:Zinc finger CCCH-type containing 7B n=1 Tax=Callorhinchus milii TaxID=7868 RepID=A0A4W3H5W5_CALMI
MSSTSPGRQQRKEQIQKGLDCHILSCLKAFLHQLVKNLLEEGNALYREWEYKAALAQYVEALNVADYAESDGVIISQHLLENLYVNRAACYFFMSAYEKALEDCEHTLKLNENNYRALYRKTRALNEMGKHKEAYDCIAKCSLAVPQDENVVKLTQELAQRLGLRIRKAYIRAQVIVCQICVSFSSLFLFQLSMNGIGNIDDIESDSPLDIPCVAAPTATSTPASEPSISMSGSICIQESPSPPPASLEPPTAGDGVSLSVPESTEEFTDGEIIGEDIDTLLDSIQDYPMSSAPGPIPTNVPANVSRLPSVFPVGTPLLPPAVKGSTVPTVVTLPLVYSMQPTQKMDTLDSIGPNKSVNSLDTLDLFVGPDSQAGKHSLLRNEYLIFLIIWSFNPRLFVGPCGVCPSLLHVALRGAPGWVVPPLTKNPLVETHDLRQACNMCFIKSGSKAFDYTYNPELDHKCKNDLLIGRLKVSADPRWKKIRPRPTKNNYAGPYYICKDIASKEDCKYGDNCTFAYCPEEIDVWTLERKGAINRELLFDPLGGSTRSSLTVAKILKDHLGLFIFLCEECFDSKPRLISQRNKASPAVCSNLETSHKFDTNKCMVHMLRTTTVNYCKIRQFKDYCQFDVCRHEVRYGCLREDSCNFAHSLVELKVWVLQQNSAISHEEIVQEGKQYWQSLEASRAQVSPSIGKSPSLDMKMKFVCGQCWRNGQVIEPDKTLKYCSAKARHGWTKERRVLLVMSNERKKWVSIRPLPPCKSQPQQYDLCLHVTNGKKCQYIGNCSFAHSIEEREVWTYMKENNMHDMQQMHDMWLKNQNPMKTGEATVLTTRQTEKQIHMPTDYAEPGMGYHCWLCGKNSNSEKQWKKHITSEKHKEKVFNSEDDQNCWQYRFPMGEFKLCERSVKNKPCSDGEACPFAHCQAELDEWLGRKDLLQMKLAKAAKDKLIATNDSDFGKYTFLMKDLN